MAYLNGNMNIMRFVTRENEAPRYKGIFPLEIDSVGDAVSEWYLYGNKQGVGEKQIVKGNLPLDFVSDGTNLENYRIYGTAEGAGETTSIGYKIPLTVTSGADSKTTVIPIGDTKLMAGDYIDYKSGKIYKAKRIHEDTVTIDGIEWDILDYDHDEVYKSDGTRAKHTVTIQTHDIVNELQYSAKQAAFAFPNGLAAGTYHFTVGAHPWVAGDVGKVLTFTLENAIPINGQLVLNGAYNRTLVGTTISSFVFSLAPIAMETVTMTEGSDGTDLGTIRRTKTDTINSIDRALLGSNNWLKSAMRQYLNSDKAAGNVWTPQTVFDRPPEWVSTTIGFLNGKSGNFISHIGTAKKTTGLNRISDGHRTDVHDEKLFLLSRSEVYMGDEYAGGEDTPYAYYKNYSDNQSASTGADKNRIKYRAGVAKNWWLRSPYASYANNVMLVSTSGAWNFGSATPTRGVAPACCIVLDDMDDWVKQIFYTEVDADLPAIETFSGENTLDSTEMLGEVTITQGYQVPLDIRSISETNEITKSKRADIIETAGATIDVDIQAGTVTINGTTNDSVAEVVIFMNVTEGDYWYSGVPKQEDNSISAVLMNTHYLPPYTFNKWDGSEPGSDIGYGEEAVIDVERVCYHLYFAPNHTYTNLVIKPKLQKATITDTKNIYVGNKPLGEGEMVSKESTNIDIDLERGQSVLETTLTNKPEMIVTPDSYDKIKNMLLNIEQYDYNETQSDTITDEVTEVTQ